MKRNDLVARSLTLGLAVATAAASMSTPGGLMAPVTVQAAVTVTDENIGDYFEITDTDNVIVASSDDLSTGVEAQVSSKEQNYNGNITVSYKSKGSSGDSSETITAAGEYDVYITATVGTSFDAITEETKLGTVTVYQELASNKELTYKNGSGDAEGVKDAASKVFTDDVTVDAGEGNKISLTKEGLESEATNTVKVDKTVDQSSKPIDGQKTVVLYVKLSDDETVYAKKTTLTFDVTPPEITAATVKENDGKQVITANGATLSVTANEAGKVYYKVEAEAKTLQAAEVKGDGTSNAVDVTEGNSADISLSGLSANTQYYIYLVAEDAAGNLGAVSAPVEVKTLKAAYSGTQPAVGTFTKEGRTLTFTFAAASKEAKDFDYTLDAEQSWTNGAATNSIVSVESSNDSTTITLTLPTDAYAANAIKVRVAETDDNLAGDWVAYEQAVPEGVAPTLSAIQTADVTAADTSVKVNVISNETGKVYALAKEKGQQAPNAAAVKEGKKSTEIQSAGAATEVTVNELTANTEYVIYFVAEDAAENLSAVQSVEVKTLQTALTGIAKLDGTTTVGETLTASVESGNGSTFTYAWYRIPVVDATEQTPVQITGANESTYTLVADDAGCKIKVVITAEGFSGSKEKTTEAAVEKKTCSIELGDASSLFASGVTGDAGSKVLNVTVPETAQSSALEYSFDGTTWVDLSGAATIPLANKSYDAGTIKVRVKETEDTKAGDVVAYDKAIKATLAATVTISGELKYDQTITANATITDQAQENAALKYEFIRVTPSKEPEGEPTVKTVQAASETNTYKLTADDIGSTIKVVVTADNYEDGNVTATTETIQKADAREVADVTVTKNLNGEVYNYTVTALSGDGAQYCYVEGSYESYQAAVDDSKNPTLASTNTFNGLTPGKTYTFFATYDQADTKYEKSAIKCLVETVPLLQRPALSLNVAVSAYQETGKTVTITNVENAEYSFAGADGAYNATNTKNYTADDIDKLADKSITVAIRYPHDDKYADVAPLTQTINLSKEYQTAPDAASVTVVTNANKTKYQLTITPPAVDDGITLEYSVDGKSFTTEEAIEAMEFDAGQTVNVYVRKAAYSKDSKDYDASSAAVTPKTTSARSAAPTISSVGDVTTFKDSLDVTLTATDGVTIYYTTDGTEPTVNTETSATTTKTITISASTTVTAIAVENNKIVSTVVSKTFTKDTSVVKPVNPPENNNPWTGPSTTTPSTDDKKPETKPETKPENQPVTETETKADGTKVTTTETKAEDGSVTAKVELKNETTGVEATVKVAKDADGKVTDATAAVTQTSADKKAGISAATVAQITEAAGTKAVEIKAEIVDESGNTLCRLTANAEDLKAGNKLKVLKYDSKTREYVLVNKTTYKVDKDGNVAMNDLKRARYMVVTASEAETFSKQVLKTVKVETAKKNVTAGKKTKITLDDGLNMANVAKITYKTSRKSVATVNKNGTITTKKAGTVTVRATVTLKNGKTKSVKMTLTVKKAK